MSDYVQNPEYSMQLPAPDDDPASYDWARLQEEVDQTTISPFGDITVTSLQEDTGVEAMDWSALNNALENGPWRDIFHWRLGDDQSAEAQPGDRHGKSHPDPNNHMTPHWPCLEPVEIQDIPEDEASRFSCDVRGCTKSFASKGNLVRHQKLHAGDRKFPCPSQECRPSFTRKDKLIDHLRAGHEEDELFLCPRPSCQALLTRDVLPLHILELHNMNRYRQCPLPRCSFRAHVRDLGDLQKHLLEGHDSKGRQRFASLLASRGYDAESADVVCVLCPDLRRFSAHKDFCRHVLNDHCSGYRESVNEPHGSNHFLQHDLVPFPYEWLKNDCSSPGLHQHRRTILRVWPGYWTAPVWDDLNSHTL